MKIKIAFILALIFAGSVGYSQKLQINIHHFFGAEALVLNQKSFTMTSNEKVVVSTLKYYLGNFSVEFESGKIFRDSVHYHLIDLADASTMNIRLDVIPDSKVKSVSFGIGVDSLTNSKGLMNGDLDPMNGMYWAWSSGFINFKLEGTFTKGNSRDEFSYHIGGFLKPNESYRSVTIRPQKAIDCKQSALNLNFNLITLFEHFSVSDLPKILSPSIKAKKFSFELPQLFSIVP